MMKNTVTRTKVGHSSYEIKEHWTCESKEDMMDLFQSVEREYPAAGYGTTLWNVRQDPTGILWHAEFTRYTSCD